MSKATKSKKKSTEDDGLIEVEVRCAFVSYFDTVPDVHGNGQQKVNAVTGEPLVITRRHTASMGQVIRVNQVEYDRLAAEDAIQEPGSAMLANDPRYIPTATPFGIVDPRYRPEGEEEPLVNTDIGDPRSAPAAAVNQPLTDEAHVAAATGDPDDDAELDLETATVPDIAAWIKKDKVSIATLLELAEDDPETATKLSLAEQALGAKARQSAIDQLDAIANDSGQSDDGQGDDGDNA